MLEDLVTTLSQSEAAAAWAQAIGATVAIGLTWWLARREARAAQRQQVEQMKIALFLIAHAKDHLSRASKGFENEAAVAMVAAKLLRNDALDQTRKSMVRAEERGGMPVVALSALISASSDITRAMTLAESISAQGTSEKVARFNGIVATLRLRGMDLAENLARRGGFVADDDPVVLRRWLHDSPARRILKRLRHPIWMVKRWSLQHDNKFARLIRRLAFRHSFSFIPANPPDEA